MNRRNFIASTLFAPVAVDRLQSPQVAYLSTYCFWIGPLYVAATEEGGHWDVYLSYYRDGDERSTAFPLVLQQALLKAGFGTRRSPGSHFQALVFQSTLEPNEVIRRCEAVMIFSDAWHRGTQ